MSIPRLLRPSVLALLLGCYSVGSAETAQASNKYLEIPAPRVAESTLAYRIANMSNEDVQWELDQRQVPYELVEPVPGVRLAVRLTGRLHGVWIHSVLPPEERRTTPFEILDGRLALALDEFCKLLETHGIVEVIHFTMYRPPHEGGAELGKYRDRHPGGMAIDLGAMKKSTGQLLAVGPHWPAELGARTCGEGARQLRGRRGREIQSLACEAGDLKLFHYTLSPHFDEAHSDHLHMEVKTEVKWFLVN